MYICVEIPIRLRRHIGLWVSIGMSVSDGKCRSPIGIRSGILVSDGACQSPMKHVKVFN